MKIKILAVVVALAMVAPVGTPQASAVGASQAAASLFLPTTGQAMNGQLGNTKTKIMAGLEVGLIATLAILGGLVGGGVTWAALGPLIANHLWSSVDAYQSAQNQVNPLVQQQMVEAQRTLDFSRQRRYEREQTARSDIRERIRLAGERATY